MGTDTFSKEKRSEIMSRVGHRNTKPELLVRSALHGMGFRFRIHRDDLPGVLDIVLPKYRTVIFVHGCFWHRHPNCKRATTPKQNADYWKTKFDRTTERDVKNIYDLEALGWKIVIVWECETNRMDNLLDRLAILLQDLKPSSSHRIS